MRPFPTPTPIQEIALNLVFDVMSECRFNRSYEEYMEIRSRLPALKKLHYQVNERLADLRKTQQLPQICRFKAGHQKIVYEPYPVEISYETLRAALTVSGMRTARRQKRRQSGSFALGLTDGKHPFILIGPVGEEIDLSHCQIALL